MWWWGSNPTYSSRENVSFSRESAKMSPFYEPCLCVCVCVCTWLLMYHLCASISGNRGGRHRAHLGGNVLQAAVGRPGSAQLSVDSRVGHHSEGVGVGAGHRQWRAQAGGCNAERCNHDNDVAVVTSGTVQNLRWDGVLRDSPRVSTPGGLLAAALRAEVVLGAGASAWDVGVLDLDTGVVDFSF